MLTDIERGELNRLTEKVLECAFRVSNTLGCGFLEKVYENALALELKNQELPIEQQKPVNVGYGGEVVGVYVADLLVGGAVLVELKAVRAFEDVHRAQCLNYLKATGLHICLLLYFAAPRLEIQRIVSGF